MSEYRPWDEVPTIIKDQRVPRSEEEAAYLALVRLCHERGEWYPEATYMQVVGWTGIDVRRPTDQHPVLEDTKYHRYGDPEQPLNLRGRKKLSWMQYNYDKTESDYWKITMAG